MIWSDWKCFTQWFFIIYFKIKLFLSAPGWTNNITPRLYIQMISWWQGWGGYYHCIHSFTCSKHTAKMHPYNDSQVASQLKNDKALMWALVIFHVANLLLNQESEKLYMVPISFCKIDIVLKEHFKTDAYGSFKHCQSSFVSLGNQCCRKHSLPCNSKESNRREKDL
jgi:hypothetical protein